MNYLHHNKVNYLDNTVSGTPVVTYNDFSDTASIYNFDYLKYTNNLIRGLAHTVIRIDILADTITSKPATIVSVKDFDYCNHVLYNFSIPYTCSNFIDIPDDTTVTFTVTLDNLIVKHVIPVNKYFINTFSFFNIIPAHDIKSKIFTITAETNNNTELALFDVKDIESHYTIVRFIGYI